MFSLRLRLEPFKLQVTNFLPLNHTLKLPIAIYNLDFNIRLLLKVYRIPYQNL